MIVPGRLAPTTSRSRRYHRASRPSPATVVAVRMTGIRSRRARIASQISRHRTIRQEPGTNLDPLMTDTQRNLQRRQRLSTDRRLSTRPTARAPIHLSTIALLCRPNPRPHRRLHPHQRLRPKGRMTLTGKIRLPPRTVACSKTDAAAEQRWLTFEHPDPAVLLGKLQRHHRAQAFLALNANMPAMISHDTLDDHEPEPVPAGLRRMIG